MTIECKGYSISVEMNDTFGKCPGLYVVSKNQALKVGNFASEEKARIFEDYLRYMFGCIGQDELWKGWEEDEQ